MAKLPLSKDASKLSLISELFVLYKELSLGLGIYIPFKVVSAFVKVPELNKFIESNWIKKEVGDGVLDLMNKLGPVYGKMGQVYLSRLNENQQKEADRWNLNRLYGDWPSLDISEIKEILDTDIPEWRGEFDISSTPIGVASMAQVHVLTRELDGKEFVVKVLKPNSVVRLKQTVSAIRSVSSKLKPIAMTSASRKALSELDEFVEALEDEISLDKERANILKMKKALLKRKSQVLRLPEIESRFCSDRVIVMEKFDGPSLANIVNGKVELSTSEKRILARKVLKELLIQVFELGLFHGDPHAGNLILLEDGSVGLFDWGLAGELTASDRKHIAALLKAVMAMDMDSLCDALFDMARSENVTVDRRDIEKELKSIKKMIIKAREQKKRLGLDVLMNKCLDAASKLGIPVPEGLLLMAKSLLTIEGLARGIDPDVKLVRVASPVLFRAARPGVEDFVKISRKLPTLAKMWFSSK